MNSFGDTDELETDLYECLNERNELAAERDRLREIVLRLWVRRDVGQDGAVCILCGVWDRFYCPGMAATNFRHAAACAIPTIATAD